MLKEIREAKRNRDAKSLLSSGSDINEAIEERVILRQDYPGRGLTLWLAYGGVNFESGSTHQLGDIRNFLTTKQGEEHYDWLAEKIVEWAEKNPALKASPTAKLFEIYHQDTYNRMEMVKSYYMVVMEVTDYHILSFFDSKQQALYWFKSANETAKKNVKNKVVLSEAIIPNLNFIKGWITSVVNPGESHSNYDNKAPKDWDVDDFRSWVRDMLSARGEIADETLSKVLNIPMGQEIKADSGSGLNQDFFFKKFGWGAVMYDVWVHIKKELGYSTITNETVRYKAEITLNDEQFLINLLNTTGVSSPNEYSPDKLGIKVPFEQWDNYGNWLQDNHPDIFNRILSGFNRSDYPDFSHLRGESKKENKNIESNSQNLKEAYVGTADILLPADGSRDSMASISRDPNITKVEVYFNLADVESIDPKTPAVYLEPFQNIYRAYPIDMDGNKISGMFSGAWIYSHDSRFPDSPVRLMDRHE